MQIDIMPNGVPRVGFIPLKYGRPLDVDGRAEFQWKGLIDGRAHSLAYYEVLLVERGEATFVVDGQPVHVAGPDVLITAPGQVRTVHVREPLQVRFAVFSDDAVRRLTAGRPRLLTRPQLSGADVRQMRHVCASIEHELRDVRDDTAVMLDALLMQLLILIRRGGADVDDRPPLLRRLEALIDERFRSDHRVSAYAAALGTSGDRLSALARRHGAGSVKAMILRRLAREANRLLQQTDTDVAEIAYALGFDDPGYFTRFMKRMMGRSPTWLRRAP